MRYLGAVLIPILLFIGCAGEALVEFGANDDVLFDAPLGDIVMRVLMIEIPEGEAYTTIWDYGKQVVIPVQAGEFVTITDSALSVVPGTYDHVRVTVDSVRYVSDSTMMLIDTAFVFNANAFTNLIIDENDEMRLVINIVSSSWFDANNVQLIDDPFNQAALRVYHD